MKKKHYEELDIFQLLACTAADDIAEWIGAADGDEDWDSVL